MEMVEASWYVQPLQHCNVRNGSAMGRREQKASEEFV